MISWTKRDREIFIVLRDNFRMRSRTSAKVQSVFEHVMLTAQVCGWAGLGDVPSRLGEDDRE